MVVLHRPVVIRQIGPRHPLDVIARALEVRVPRTVRRHDREEVFAAARDRRRRLRSENDSRLRVPVHRLIERQTVGDGGDLHHGVQSVLNRVRHPGKPLRDLAVRVWIVPVALLLQRTGDHRAILRVLLVDLVANRPHHDGRMVAALLHEIPDVALPPVREEAVVAVLDLCGLPAVERLRHHQDAEFVADLELCLARHVVRCPERIAAHLLEQRHLPAERIPVERRAKRSQVMMKAHALELARLSVQQELPVAVPKRPHADPLRRPVGELSARRIDLGDERVELRVLRRPRFERTLQLARFGRRHLARAVKDTVHDLPHHSAALGRHPHRPEVGAPHRIAPCAHARRTAEDKLHGTDQSRARIPPRAVRPVREPHRHQMPPRRPRQLHLEGVVTVLPFADLDAVAIDLRLTHRPVEDE